VNAVGALDVLAELVGKELEVISDFLTKPVGVYETRDRMIRAFREALIKLVGGAPRSSSVPGTAKILRE
jgi:hypothetical protein